MVEVFGGSVFYILEYFLAISDTRGVPTAAICLSGAGEQPIRTVKLSGWAELEPSDQELVSEILNEITVKIRADGASVQRMNEWENAVRIRGPFPISDLSRYTGSNGG